VTDSPDAGSGNTAGYRDLLAILPEPHWVLGARHRVVAANFAAAELVGRPLGSLSGLPLNDLVADPPAKVGRFLTMCARSRQMVPGALTFLDAHGSPAACRCDGAVLRPAGAGAPALVLLRCRSRIQATSRFVALTDRVDALNREVALRTDAERVLRRQAGLLEQTHDAVSVWVLDGGEITYLNRAAEDLYGWPRAEALGRGAHDLLQTEPGALRAAMQQLVHETGEWSGELVHTTRQGRKITVESRMVRMFGEDGPALVLETARDVTDARRLRAHLEATQRLEAIGRVAGGAAHEINNSLQGAVGFASFALQRLAEDHPAREDVSEVLKASERAAAITVGLLAFSRRQLLQPSDLSLDAAIAESAPMCRQALGAARELRLELPAQPVMVFADRGQLEQVLVNFVLNARDATEPGGWMRIRVGSTLLQPSDLVRLGRPDLSAGSFACVEVEDSGHGMDQATAARIFEPFYTTKPQGKGTGLGLAVVHGIVHQSGGAISVRSAPGHGTTFTIYLPLAAGHTRPMAPEEPAAARGGAEHVLVVDDEPVILQMAARLLEAEGYTVLTAVDGAEALRRLAEAPRNGATPGKLPVDMVLTDIVMPVLGGRELGDAIARLYPGLPVLFTSGHPGEEMVRRGLLHPGAVFIQKPFRPEQLLVRLRSVLDHGHGEVP
jgi:PAS domain S-box-containing protein